MIGQKFHHLANRSKVLFAWVTLLSFLLTSAVPVVAVMNATRGGALPQPLPLFPADNWWNLDIRNWPVDSNSQNFINFIGTSRQLHPDFGGRDSSTQYGIYGIPYAVVTGVTDVDLKAVQFQYWDESDGVNLNTGVSFPFYPIPPQAATEPFWIEGGNPGNIDERCCADRHLLIVDRDRNYLYELYNVFYNTSQAKWYAGSGAFFDMNTNTRRPDTWTSADAAGLAMLPGLVRYDEVYDPAITEIRHAFRVTVRATNGYVYPASHRAGSTSGALPMGARLRLKASVDVTQRTNDPNMQKIFRAMQTYGLIVADNGSDMYITGTHDTRWNNDILNPAFGTLRASDFEVVQLGYNPTVTAPALSSVSVNPATVSGGQSTSGTVNLTAAAPAGGVTVNLASANSAATLPSTVNVAAGAPSATFTVTTSPVAATTAGNITASYNGVTKSATLTVNPPASAALSALSLNPTVVRGGVNNSVGTVSLTAPAPTGGMVVNLSSSNPSKAAVPTSVTVTAGTTSATFTVTTAAVSRKIVVTISASQGGTSKTASLAISKR